MTINNTEKNFDFRIFIGDASNIIKRLWWILIVICILMAGILFCYTVVNFTPQYVSSVTFTVDVHTVVPDKAASKATSSGINKWVYTFSYSGLNYKFDTIVPLLMTSDIMYDNIVKSLNAKKLNGSITVTNEIRTNLFTASVKSTNPNDAYNIANALVANAEKVMNVSVGLVKLNVISSPQLPVQPINISSYYKRPIIGFLLGLLVDVLIIIVYSINRNTIRTDYELQCKLDYECFAHISKVKIKRTSSLLSYDIGDKRFQNQIKELTSKMVATEKRIILITSTLYQEGKTVLAINIAKTLVNYGNKVLLVDVNQYTQSLKEKLKISEKTLGFPDILIDGIKPHDTIFKKNSIDLIISDTPFTSTSEDLIKAQTAIIQELSEEYDYIIFLAAPCSHLITPLSISCNIDIILYVIKQDYAKTSLIEDCFGELKEFDEHKIETVMTGVNKGLGGYGVANY